MKRTVFVLLFLMLSCATLPVNEPATASYAESIQQKAKQILNDPVSTDRERTIADELYRSGNLIRVVGKRSAQDQAKIVDLSEDKGWKDGLVWAFTVVAVLVAAALLFLTLWIIKKKKLRGGLA